MGPDVHRGALTPHDGRTAAARPWRERADPILAAVVFALFARTFLFQAFAVPTRSMEKTVLTGDRLLVNKFLYAPRGGPLARFLPGRAVRRGDIVVFRYPADPRRNFIKRVVGLPGETIAIRDRRVFANGRPLEEPWAFHSDDRVWPDDPAIPADRRRRDQLAPLVVPDGAYFVLGDNRDDSSDSREWGPVPEGHLEGRALFVYWSLPPRPSDAPTGGIAALRFPLDLLRRTRWERAFLPVR
jgi:signal peptidase I